MQLPGSQSTGIVNLERIQDPEVKAVLRNLIRGIEELHRTTSKVVNANEVVPGSIDTAELADGAVTEEKIDSAVLVKYGFTTGDAKISIKSTADPGWVVMNDGTMGNASSGGTTRANADTEDLFTLLWNNTVDANCAVSTGRGASAAADFAANKTIALPKVLGRAIAIAGAGSGLTARALAAILGEETHTLTEDEMPIHDHSGTGAGSAEFLYVRGAGGIYTIGGGTTVDRTAANVVVNNAGGGDAHNNMQPSTFFHIHLKL